jgi:signal transduction histidine kinase
VVERVLAAFAAERTLAGVEFDYEGGRGPNVVRGDEQLLGIALAGLVSAVHALVEHVRGARVRVEVGPTSPPGGASVTVSQEAVSLPPAWRSRFFELGWPERPGGVSSGAGLAAARRVAELHGGKVQLSTSEHGCALTLSIPLTRD